MNINSLLTNRKYIFYDGAMGTMLQKHGMPPGTKTGMMNITNPGIVEKIHKMYIDAGSDIICANTFYINSLIMENTGYSTDEAVRAAVKAARAAAGTADGRLVALDIGPTGKTLEPAGEMSFDEAYDIYKELAVAGAASGVDLAACETFSDANELRAAMKAIRDNTDLPIFATMTFDKTGYTYMGCTPEKFAETAQQHGAVAIGINCSHEPDVMFDVTKRIADATTLPLIVKLNAGLPDYVSGNYSIGPQEYADQMLAYKELGVRIIGGCCGTSPEYIQTLKKVFTDEQ